MKTTLVGLFLLVSITLAQSQSIALRNDIDDHWTAGSVAGVRFVGTQLAGGTLYVGLVPTNQADGGYRVSTGAVSGDGPDTDAFTVPFGMPSGYYNILLVVEHPLFPKFLFSVRGRGVIQISSSITSPALDETLKAGKPHIMTWNGKDSGVDYYSVYLVGGSLGNTSGIFLGNVPADQGWFEWTPPKDIVPSAGFQLQLSGRWATGANSESFNIVHDRRKSTRF